MSEGLRGVDANLLLALHALLEERNLTRAGSRMLMSQPAMSGALARLRKHFGDELLVRTKNEFEPTPLALRLAPIVAQAIESAEALVGTDRPFEAQQSDRVFSVTLSEYAMTVLAAPLTRAVRERAPHASLAFDTMPASADALESQMTRRDLLIGPDGYGMPGQASPLFTDRLVCVVAEDNPRLREGRLTLQDLREMPHALAEFGARGRVKRPLEVVAEQVGMADRYIRVEVTSLLAVPVAVSGTELCGFVPSRLAHRCLLNYGLTIAQVDLPEVRITESAHWHPRRANDPAGVWLRQLMYDVAIELEDDIDDVEAAPRPTADVDAYDEVSVGAAR